jgi:hypothetical protein
MELKRLASARQAGEQHLASILRRSRELPQITHGRRADPWPLRQAARAAALFVSTIPLRLAEIGIEGFAFLLIGARDCPVVDPLGNRDRGVPMRRETLAIGTPASISMLA